MAGFATGLAVLTALTQVAPAFDAAPRSHKSKRASPNIVFILIDDMGWADGACFGSKFYETPNIDKLAVSGTRFTQAYAASAVCSPSRASLLTGKYPARLHITDWIPGEGAPGNSRFTVPNWQQSLPLNERTLAEALGTRGYATVHLGKWHLGGKGYLPQNQGFDLNIAGGDIGHPASYFWPYGAATDDHRVPDLAERNGKKGDYLTDQLTDEALRFIEQHRNRPFFLNLCHYAVHAPLMGKKELIKQASERPPANGQSNETYAAMLRSVDDSVGRVVGKLDELHLTNNTVVVFSSDNGGAVHFGEPQTTSNWPLRNGKGSAYEGGLRVPLVIKLPAQTQGVVCQTPVITMDFYPTLMELVGAPPSASKTALDGKSMVPLLRGSRQTLHNELFWHYPHYWNGGKVSPYDVVRMGDWKLIRFYETGQDELYDLRNDISETRDLATSYPAKKNELIRHLDSWLKGIGAQMPERRPVAAGYQRLAAQLPRLLRRASAEGFLILSEKDRPIGALRPF